MKTALTRLHTTVVVGGRGHGGVHTCIRTCGRRDGVVERDGGDDHVCVSTFGRRGPGGHRVGTTTVVTVLTCVPEVVGTGTAVGYGTVWCRRR